LLVHEAHCPEARERPSQVGNRTTSTKKLRSLEMVRRDRQSVSGIAQMYTDEEGIRRDGEERREIGYERIHEMTLSVCSSGSFESCPIISSSAS